MSTWLPDGETKELKLEEMILHRITLNSLRYGFELIYKKKNIYSQFYIHN